MKFENFEKAKALVEQIDKHKKTLDSLSGEEVTVTINFNMHNNGRIMAIGIWKSCEHEYTGFAWEFVRKIKEDIINQITELKTQLELL